MPNNTTLWQHTVEEDKKLRQEICLPWHLRLLIRFIDPPPKGASK